MEQEYQFQDRTLYIITKYEICTMNSEILIVPLDY